MKICRVCKVEKPSEEFWKHPQYKDGRDTRCAACSREYVNKLYQNPKAKETKRAYRRTEKSRAYQAEYRKVHKRLFRERWSARNKVYRAIQRGTLKRKGCEACGEKAHAHHEDYSKPLEVRWLCAKHHGELHQVKELTIKPTEDWGA